jgi:hypothetical protein
VRKTIDPKRAALLDRRQLLLGAFEKDFTRLARVMHRLEKTRRALSHIARELAKTEE